MSTQIRRSDLTAQDLAWYDEMSAIEDHQREELAPILGVSPAAITSQALAALSALQIQETDLLRQVWAAGDWDWPIAVDRRSETEIQNAISAWEKAQLEVNNLESGETTDNALPASWKFP
ncbi:hypothetical protein [Pseudomonas sp. AB12(2023)]|uniref:hypothetical protein n=1 Tax=Pseudomonas sp. AB12(2023) TaxID=3048597 RepID=UPI002B238AB0|nr:hypothetical protein [Pseudomonas sp. AB12(2023)]MEB0221364.1 hypothetical protein [Pseudomonas sp. AB12(2023)]